MPLSMESDKGSVCFHRDSVEEDVGQCYGHFEEEVFHSSEDEDDGSSSSSKEDHEENHVSLFVDLLCLIQMYI